MKTAKVGKMCLRVGYRIGSSKNTGLGKVWLEREISEAYLTGPGPGGGILEEFLGGDVLLGHWNP